MMAMPKIVDTPIVFTCPVCGKITKIMGGEGMLGPIPLDWHIGKNRREYCHCGEKQPKK
jgi:hypothetical protein